MEGYGENVVLIAIGRGPPLTFAKAFSPSGCGRIFPLFSRVVRDGLSAAPAARWPGSGVSGRIFSGPHECAVSVFRMEAFGIVMFV